MASSPTRAKCDVRRNLSRCSSLKIGYPTRSDALDEAERLMSAGMVRPGCHQTPYECPECCMWHVGNRVIVPVDDPFRHRA